MMRMLGIPNNNGLRMFFWNIWRKWNETPPAPKPLLKRYAETKPSTPELTKNTAKRQKRRRSAYSANYTAALQFPCSGEELEAMNNKHLLQKSKNYIIEHAARRVDLFFYTLIAYYKTEVHPKQGPTHLQHGKGRTLDNKNLTQACHSCFVPSLVDESVSNHSILSGTHFMDSLNSTVELPPYVNELDSELETFFSCRVKSLAIIGEVAAGEINPVQGLTKFLIMMDKLLHEIEMKDFRIDKFFARYKNITAELIRLTKLGTLEDKFSSETKEVSEDYIELLLRLTPEEKTTCQLSEEAREAMYQAKAEEIQAEILKTKSSFGMPLTAKVKQ